MDENFENLRGKIYDLEMLFSEISMLTDIIKNFAECSAEISDGPEKMYYLSKILCDKNAEFKKMLSEFIPEFQLGLKST